jgi:ABC-type polysaccharide/polyol phosphate export permease
LITEVGIFKKIMFWILMMFFLVTNFIRIFIDSNFGGSIREYFRDVPIAIKIIIVILFISGVI